MRLFIGLSLNSAPHKIILRITIFWAGRPDFLGPVVLQPVLGDFGCVLGGQATKSTVIVRPKDFFVLILDKKWRLPPQYPGFGSKLSLKGKPGTCALFLETFQSPVDFFLARKAFWTASGVLSSAYIFLWLMMVCLLYVKPEMRSFPKSFAKHFCD